MGRTFGYFAAQDMNWIKSAILLRPQGPSPDRQHVRGDQGVGCRMRHHGVGQLPRRYRAAA